MIAVVAVFFCVDCVEKPEDGGEETHVNNPDTSNPNNNNNNNPNNGGNPSVTTFQDSRDNKTYNKVTIGTQTWMAQNLNYNATGSVCYNNSADSCAKYGRLYNWTDALTACPSGWYLPSDAEWTVLTGFVGGATAAARRTCFRFVVCRTDYNVSSKQRFSGGLCSLELVMTNRVSRD